jgi:hypothetical protein
MSYVDHCVCINVFMEPINPDRLKLTMGAASYDTIILINYTCIAEVWQAKQSEIV